MKSLHDAPMGLTDDDTLAETGDVMLGAVTAHFYSAEHPSPANKAFVDACKGKTEPLAFTG